VDNELFRHDLQVCAGRFVMKCAIFIGSVRLNHVQQAMAESFEKNSWKTFILLLSSLFIPANEQSLISDLTSWEAAY
jgi:hypothetical protein